MVIVVLAIIISVGNVSVCSKYFEPSKFPSQVSFETVNCLIVRERKKKE